MKSLFRREKREIEKKEQNDELWKSVEVRTSLGRSQLSLRFHARFGAQARPHLHLLLVVRFSPLSFFSLALNTQLSGIEILLIH